MSRVDSLIEPGLRVLESAERRVLPRVIEPEVVAFAQELVATPSSNPPGDERQAAELVRQRMTSLGFRAVRTVAKEEARPNVVGEVGREAASLILNGHLDTKPPGDEDEWETPPYEPVIRNGRLHGLGSTDMKAAVADYFGDLAEKTPAEIRSIAEDNLVL